MLARDNSLHTLRYCKTEVNSPVTFYIGKFKKRIWVYLNDKKSRGQPKMTNTPFLTSTSLMHACMMHASIICDTLIYDASSVLLIAQLIFNSIQGVGYFVQRLYEKLQLFNFFRHAFSNVSSNCLLEMMQSHTGCICWTFHLCES